MKKKLVVFILIAGLLSIVFFVIACASSDGSYEDSSKTNVQVEVVDEPDIVKVTDEGYIYKVQSDGITVSKATDGYAKIISKTSVPLFTPQEIFINDNFLVVIGYQKLYDNSYDTIIYLYDTNELTKASGGEITTGIAPKRVTTIFKAEYFTARIYDNIFYLVVSDRLVQNEVKFSDTIEGDKSSERIEISKASSTRKLFTIIGLELKGFTEEYFIRTYVGDISEIYCSLSAIYALSYARNFGGCNSGYRTQITKISYKTLKVEAENSVPGTVKDRFSLFDSGDNFFAVSYNSGSPMLTSFTDRLEPVSSISFAYGERLYSVRYEEGFCYAVTFKQIDPLFKIDISDPSNLRIIGELKIPGFSNYMQGFGKDRMIGIGYAGDLRTDEGSQLKISLFDTSKDEPVEINNIILNSNTSSLAYTNPKAILCEVENNIFAFEVTERDYNYSGKIIKQSIFILGVDEDALFVRANLSSLDYTAKSDKTRSYFTRLTRIKQYLYAISDGYIVSYDINDFSLIAVTDTRIKKDMYTVSFLTNLDYVITNSVEEGKKVSEPKNLVKSGYTFDGWYLDNEFTISYDFDNSISKNIILYAKWIEII